VNWSWGDGAVTNTSTLLTFNASHTYSSGGKYTVSESAANPYNTSIATQPNYITVYNQTASGFTGTPTSGLYPLTVQFNLTSMNNNATYVNWSWGDGTVTNATTLLTFNASHIYTYGGTFTVNETAVNPYNTSIFVQPNYITVYNQTASGFTGTPTSGLYPLTVQFNLTSMFNNATWVNWSWGDGAVTNTSTLLTFNASHTYSSGGKYTVSESAANPYNTSIATQPNYITVYNQTVSGFTGSPTSGLSPLTVQFNLTSMFNNATWVNWSWGDGAVTNTSTLLTFNASHTYSSGGTYTVIESAANPSYTSITTLSNYITVSSWTIANGCWTATLGNQNLVMWNATGISTWTAPTAIMPNVWYLVVAGGGGGGRYGGGGGAGGFLNGTLTVSSGSTYTVTVGTSGTGATTAAVGGSGRNSSFANTTPTNGIQAMGGGGGGSSSGTLAIRSGAAGGSGGGGVRGGVAPGTGGNGVAPQGNNGGAGSTSGGNYYGGGGGGGTGTGVTAAGTACGNGGNGNVSFITGTSGTYAGGGGGGGFTGGTFGLGGTGGGGAGGVGATAGTNGTPNLGGGGGGGGSTGNGGYGGTGIVIISYSLWNQTVSGFTGLPTSGLAPLAVQFNRTIPNDNATMWNWSFGDGSVWFNTTTVTAANASHTYNSGGTYSVTLIAQNPGRQNTTVQSNYIAVYNNTVSGFTANVTSGLFPLAVQFNLTTMANNATYVNWTFGDGSVANLTSPATFNATHTYSSGGTYTVIESAANPSYTNITTQQNYITVNNKTVSGFTGTPTSGLFPLAVQFNRTNPTNDNATMWNWSYGDGSAWFNTTTLSLANASHSYSSSGTYTVTFVAQNPYYLNTTVMSNYITVGNPTVSGFTGTPTSGLFPLAVQFNRTNPTNDNATMWNWSFGDGSAWFNTTTLSLANASHTYSSGGTYTVTFVAQNPYYLNTTVMSNYITVNNKTVSGFTANVTSGIFPFAVQFNLTTMANNATYVNWTWGDGTYSNTSTLQTFNASHTYSSGGTFTVSESASNPYYTNTTTQLNYISSLSFVDITLNEGSITLGLAAGSSATDSSLIINTTANVPFAITVADSSGRSTYQGYLGSYTGSGYDSGGPDLASPLGLAGTTTGTTTAQTITPPILSAPQTFYSGSAAVTNQNLPTLFTQPAVFSDPHLTGGSSYRIALSFIIQTV
jgi:PKD repeat protein